MSGIFFSFYLFSFFLSFSCFMVTQEKCGPEPTCTPQRFGNTGASHFVPSNILYFLCKHSEIITSSFKSWFNESQEFIITLTSYSKWINLKVVKNLSNLRRIGLPNYDTRILKISSYVVIHAVLNDFWGKNYCTILGTYLYSHKDRKSSGGDEVQNAEWSTNHGCHNFENSKWNFVLIKLQVAESLVKSYLMLLWKKFAYL